MQTILGIKNGQTQKFTADGVRIPVTVIHAEPVFVVQVKTQEKDGYFAVQLGIGFKREKNVKRPVVGHIKKAGLPAGKAGVEKLPRFLREIRLEENEASEFKPGDQIRGVDLLRPGDVVNVTGISKGKGFAGVVKRWGFAGGPKTHGQSDRERAPGSIGSTTTPGRVLRGKRMAGRMGRDRVTIKNLLVVGTDAEENRILIRGLVPGVKGGLLFIAKVGEDKKFIKQLEMARETQETETQEIQENQETQGKVEEVGEVEAEVIDQTANEPEKKNKQ